MLHLELTIGSQLRKHSYNSKTCSILPEYTEYISVPGVIDICEREAGDYYYQNYEYYARWVLSNTTSPQPTSPPSSQVVFLDGYLNTRRYTNGSCTAIFEIYSRKLNECSKRSFTTATSTIITFKTFTGSNCETGTESSISTMSYQGGVCDGTTGYIYTVSPKITSDLTVPRVTRRSDYCNRYRYENCICELTLTPFHLSDYTSRDDLCEADPQTGSTYLLNVCMKGLNYTLGMKSYHLSIQIIGCDDLWILTIEYEVT
jgi:hypothetical protein